MFENDNSEQQNYWISYTDLLTGLLAVFMLMAVIVITKQNKQDIIAIETRKTVDSLHLLIDSLNVNCTEKKAVTVELDEYKKIQKLYKAFKEMKSKFYTYNNETKRFLLNVDVSFPVDEYSIADLPEEMKNDLKKAGEDLCDFLCKDLLNIEGMSYLIIIEGNAQRHKDYKDKRELGYILSYKRALGLAEYWKNHKCNLIEYNNDTRSRVELLIVGSGYFGKSRDSTNEVNNRKFTIQIAPVVSGWKKLK